MDREIELEYENKILNERIGELEKEITLLRQIVKDNDLEDEIGEIAISDEEFICINEIKKMKQLSETSGLTKDDVQALDILHKNLRMIRGMKPDKKSKKKADVKELFKIVENAENK